MTNQGQQTANCIVTQAGENQYRQQLQQEQMKQTHLPLMRIIKWQRVCVSLCVSLSKHTQWRMHGITSRGSECKAAIPTVVCTLSERDSKSLLCTCMWSVAQKSVSTRSYIYCTANILLSTSGRFRDIFMKNLSKTYLKKSFALYVSTSLKQQTVSHEKPSVSILNQSLLLSLKFLHLKISFWLASTNSTNGEARKFLTCQGNLENTLEDFVMWYNAIILKLVWVTESCL